MRELQVFSPSHISKCPYTKPKKWVLLWDIAYFKTIFSNLIELPSVLSAESAAEKCTLLLLTASSSFANHWLPNSSQLHVANLQNQWWWTSSSEATTQSASPRDRWPDRRTWLLVISSETWKQEEWWSQTLLSQNYSIPEHQFNSHLSKLWLCCFRPPKPGVLVLFKE